MPQITYITHDGVSTTVEAEVGSSVMQTALDNRIPGIVAECGGEMMCATCHVIVDEAWADAAGESASEHEDEMLEETVVPRQATSRLSCQIKVTDELDKLVVHLPEEQT